MPHHTYHRLGVSINGPTQVSREMFRTYLDDKLVHEIRQTTQQGMVLGSESFKEEVKPLSDRRVAPLKDSPKSKRKTG